MQRLSQCLLVLGLWLGLLAGPTWAATYYTAVGGPATNCTQAQTITTPHNTIREGIECLGPGDTLYIRGGTYNETLYYGNVAFPSGTGWGAGQIITISSYPGERAIIQPASGSIGSGVIGLFHSGYSPATPVFVEYLQFLNLTLDASQVDGLRTLRFEYGTRNVRVQGCTIIGVTNSNTVAIGGYHEGDQLNPDNATWYATNFEILDNDICCAAGYGMYLSGNHDLIRGNIIHDNVGWGIHYYSDSLYATHSSTLDRNILYNNGTGLGGAVDSYGGLLATGHSNIITNNVIYGGGSTHDIGIKVVWTDNPFGTSGNTRVYNNTITGNQTEGGCIVFSNDTYGTNYGRNNICWNNTSDDIIDLRGNAFILDNLINMDPLFINPGAGDFRLGPGSPAIDAGVSLSEVTQDASAPPVARPQPPGGAYDLGAFEATEGAGATLDTFYAAASGTANTDCAIAKTPSSPYIVTDASSLNGFLACGLGGSTYVFGAGTYVASLVSGATAVASGAAGSPTTLMAAAGATVTVKSSTGGAVIWLNRGATDHHITFERLILDGDNTTGVNGLVTTPGNHHITFQDGEIKEMYYQALGIDGASDVAILRATIHDGTGGDGTPLVQVINSTNVRIAESTVYNSATAGIEVTAGSTGVLIERSTIRNNTGIGLLVAGSTVTIQNSLLYQNSKGAQWQTGTSASKAYYNTVWSNTGECFLFDTGVTTSEAKNNICWANGSAIVNNAGGGVVTTPNHTTDPSFVSTTPGVPGFLRLDDSPLSTARETATPIVGITGDFNGTSRPLGPIPDQGAFEETPAAPPPEPGLPVRVPVYGTTHFLGPY